MEIIVCMYLCTKQQDFVPVHFLVSLPRERPSIATSLLAPKTSLKILFQSIPFSKNTQA